MSFSGKETKIDWIQIDGKGDYFYHPKYPDIRVKRNENITEIEDITYIGCINFATRDFGNTNQFVFFISFNSRISLMLFCLRIVC